LSRLNNEPAAAQRELAQKNSARILEKEKAILRHQSSHEQAVWSARLPDPFIAFDHSRGEKVTSPRSSQIL